MPEHDSPQVEMQELADKMDKIEEWRAAEFPGFSETDRQEVNRLLAVLEKNRIPRDRFASHPISERKHVFASDLQLSIDRETETVDKILTYIHGHEAGLQKNAELLAPLRAEQAAAVARRAAEAARSPFPDFPTFAEDETEKASLQKKKHYVLSWITRDGGIDALEQADGGRRAGGIRADSAKLVLLLGVRGESIPDYAGKQEDLDAVRAWVDGRDRPGELANLTIESLFRRMADAHRKLLGRNRS